MEGSKLLRKARLAVKQKRLVKLQLQNTYFSVFIFLAKDINEHRDHILTENSCDCKYFIFNKIYKNKNACYHILALKIALESEDYIQINVDIHIFSEIILEIFSNGKSLKLRKLIYS